MKNATHHPFYTLASILTAGKSRAAAMHLQPRFVLTASAPVNAKSSAAQIRKISLYSRQNKTSACLQSSPPTNLDHQIQTHFRIQIKKKRGCLIQG